MLLTELPKLVPFHYVPTPHRTAYFTGDVVPKDAWITRRT